MNKLFLFVALLFISAVLAADITASNTVSTNGAIKAAKAVLKAARKGRHTVSVAVIDRSGRVRLLITDDNAGPQTEESAKQKAFTA
ncbi:hypothetical protein BGX27_005933, partial [Mortierella sp. AM989]